MLRHFGPGIGISSRTIAIGTTLACTAAVIISASGALKAASSELYVESPRQAISKLPIETINNLPYPPDVLPGRRDVATPYGSIRVYEWGPEHGEKVLLLHGISTPTISQGDLAHELVGKGYRVMLFDLFGRGYSDAPKDLPYDTRLYNSQILMVLASSTPSWSSFILVGYSLGGCLAVSFARYFPQRVKALALVAGAGLVRPYHVGWQSKLLYESNLLPDWFVRWLVRRRIRPSSAEPATAAGGTDMIAAESKTTTRSGNGDASGGQGFDSASISKYRPHVSVSSVVAWQIDCHNGFITAFLSTIRNAPIYTPQPDWNVLSSILAERRRVDKGTRPEGLEKGKLLLVLGKDDPVVVPLETIEDAETALGKDGFEAVILDAGHELPITLSAEVAGCIDDFIRK